jgi:putative heme-binding domain-containing protein
MRMYGVMVVVENLDQWNANPTEPTDPVGSNRSFIQKWTVADLAADLDQGVIGRTPAIGKRLFEEATCAGCHHAGDLKLGNVGPELDTLYARRKGDRRAVLREILEPSHRIDDAYAVQLFLTVDGDTVSGLVVEESKDTISILENPEAKEPTKLATEDIEQRVRTANSMMPKGLLDRFSKDEIMELMAFIESIQKEPQQP